MGNAGRVLMIPKGDYNAATTYEMLDCVYYNGRSYVCKQTSTGNAPTNTTYWQVMTPDSSAEIQALTNYVVDNNVKNILPFSALKNSFSSGGVDFVKQSDGSMSIANTATGDAYAQINATGIKLADGDYVYSLGRNITARIVGYTGSAYVQVGASDSGSLNFTASSAYVEYYLQVGIVNNTAYSGYIYPMIRDASITDPTYQPYAKTNVELTTLAVQKGTWTPKLYDLNTFIMDGTTSDYYKIDSLGVAFFSIPKPSSDVTISTMLQIQNVPFGTVHSGAIFTPTDLNTAQGGATGIQSQTRSDGAGVAWFRPNMVGTYPASAAQTITGYLIGKFES